MYQLITGKVRFLFYLNCQNSNNYFSGIVRNKARSLKMSLEAFGTCGESTKKKVALKKLLVNMWLMCKYIVGEYS